MGGFVWAVLYRRFCIGGFWWAGSSGKVVWAKTAHTNEHQKSPIQIHYINPLIQIRSYKSATQNRYINPLY